MKTYWMILVSLGAVLGAGCAPTPAPTTTDPVSPVPTLPPPTTPGDGEGPGWRLPDTSEEDGDIVIMGGNSLPRPPGDSSSNDPSKRSSDSSSSV